MAAGPASSVNLHQSTGAAFVSAEWPANYPEQQETAGASPHQRPGKENRPADQRSTSPRPSGSPGSCIGLASMVGEIILLPGAGSVLAQNPELLLIPTRVDLIVTGAIGHGALNQKLGQLPVAALRERPDDRPPAGVGGYPPRAATRASKAASSPRPGPAGSDDQVRRSAGPGTPPAAGRRRPPRARAPTPRVRITGPQTSARPGRS